MPAFALAAAVAALTISALLRSTLACTATAVTPGATAELCAYTTHTDDCKECDFRLALVPAAIHPHGAQRPVYLVRASYPHRISSRAPTWHASNLEGTPSQIAAWKRMRPIGHVPQVARTFALFESGSGYGMVNEHQVSIGESTCASKTVAAPISRGGRALFDMTELTQLALERAKTAREAITVMGEHAERYGFYGAEWDLRTKYAEGGEALTVSDTREAWVFHIVADDSGASAVWVARRVPDGHIAAVANAFVIRNVPAYGSDKKNFMQSANMRAVARRLNFWQGKDSAPLDFARVFGLRMPHSSYVTLRLWRIFTLANPSLIGRLNATGSPDYYPFSVKPSTPLSAARLMALQRDHFEGTPYDLTRGAAGGPYGDPDRYDTEAVDGMTPAMAHSGEFARGISLFRTSYAAVSRSCASLPREAGALVYVASQQPDASAFVPLYVHAGVVPGAMSTGSLFRFNANSLFWQVALSSNWMHRYYRHALPFVRAAQRDAEAYDVPATDVAAAGLIARGRKDEATRLLRRFSLDAAAGIFERYKRLFPELVARIHDGYVVADTTATDIDMQSFFYPRKWLARVGFFEAAETTRAMFGEKAVDGGRKMMVRRVFDVRGEDGRAAETSFALNFGSGVVLGAALCIAVVFTMTDVFKERAGYVRIQE